MPTGRLLVLAGHSVRYLAEAAVQAGWQVLALDCFGDLDTRRISLDWQGIAGPDGLHIDVDRLRAALAAASRRPGVVGWIAGSGIEAEAALLDAAPTGLPRLGLATEAVLSLRDPRRFFGVLDAAGLAHPEVSFAPPDPPAGWLHKSAMATGGWHIRPAADHPAPLGPGSYFQREQAGDSLSALFLADARHAQVVALNRQHMRPWTAAIGEPGHRAELLCPHVWQGVSGPVHAPALQAQVEAALAVLVPTFGLRGLMSLDFIDTAGRAQWLEVNARPSASLQLYPEALADGGGLFTAHLNALAGHLPEQAAAIVGACRGVWVVWADRAAVVDDHLSAELLALPDTHDLPSPGTRIEPGMPLCSVSARAPTLDALAQCLAQRVHNVLDRFHALEGVTP